MASRLVVISNRVTIPGKGRSEAAGGLAVAVKAALKYRSGIWFGWSGKVAGGKVIEPRTIEKNKITYVVIDLEDADFQEYYNGFANRALWPMLHSRARSSQPTTHTNLDGYLRVNKHLRRQYLEDPPARRHHLGARLSSDAARSRSCASVEARKPDRLLPSHPPVRRPDILLTFPRHGETLGHVASLRSGGFPDRRMTVDNFASLPLALPAAS